MLHSLQDLSSLTRNWNWAPAVKGEVLTTGPLGTSPKFQIINKIQNNSKMSFLHSEYFSILKILSGWSAYFFIIWHYCIRFFHPEEEYTIGIVPKCLNFLCYYMVKDFFKTLMTNTHAYSHISTHISALATYIIYPTYRRRLHLKTQTWISLIAHW